MGSRRAAEGVPGRRRGHGGLWIWALGAADLVGDRGSLAHSSDDSTISFIEENNAGNAAAALMAGLAPKTKVLRDGRWSEQDAAILVPGDDMVPADARLLEGDPLKIDRSALTEESLPSSERRPISWTARTKLGISRRFLTAIGNFYICSIAVGIIIEIIIMYPIQHRKYRDGSTVGAFRHRRGGVG